CDMVLLSLQIEDEPNTLRRWSCSALPLGGRSKTSIVKSSAIAARHGIPNVWYPPMRNCGRLALKSIASCPPLASDVGQPEGCRRTQAFAERFTRPNN